MNEVVKQSENNGGGFEKNPQNINRKGRPKKGQAITEILKGMLDQELEDGTTKKHLFAQKVLELALKGNESMIKLVFQYIDGMPINKVESGRGQVIPLLGGDSARQPLLVRFIGEESAKETDC
jgi:hypothetical protein